MNTAFIIFGLCIAFLWGMFAGTDLTFKAAKLVRALVVSAAVVAWGVAMVLKYWP